MGVMDAILATIQGAEEEEGRKRISGRTLLQKKLYFLSVLNQEAFGYRPHYYGPYSQLVADNVGALCQAGFLKEEVETFPESIGGFGEVKRYSCSSTEDTDALIDDRREQVEPYVKNVKMINSDQITDDVTLLSVAAKVHFIVSGQGRATRQEIMDLAKRLGGEISEKQVRQVVGYLERLELVAVDAS